jgi:hypothetical protein
VLALLLVVSAVAAVPMVMAQQTETQTNRTTGHDTAAPGAQLSGVVAVGDAELDGDVESRAYDIRVARANGSDATAAVVADQLNRTSERVAELEDRRQQLEQARDNGSMSDAEYRARVAGLHAESKNAERLADRTNETASGLPAETLAANGVDVTAIRTLQDRAANLSGPETAEIARSIAGENAGQTARPGEAPNRTDASDRGGSGSDRAGATNETSDGSTSTDGGTASGSASDDGQRPGSAGAEETTTVDGRN